MVKLKAIKNWKDTKKGDIFESSGKSAENYVSQGYAEYVNELKKKKTIKSKKIKESNTKKEEIKEVKEPIAKQILDRWATAVTPKEAIYIDGNNVAGVNQNKMQHYEERGYKGDEVLWIPPKDCIRLEFEGDKNKNHRYVLETESVLKSLEIDHCITGHGGKSDYVNIFNIKGMPFGEDNQNAKLLFVDYILPAKAKDYLDRTNLGWTLSPVIGHQHWKPKYNGAVHKILRGKNPVDHNNKYPEELLKQLKKSKKLHKTHIYKTKLSSEWVSDFLLGYCCENELPGGSRHFVIEKNLAAYIIHRKDREDIKKKYFEVQKRKSDTLRTWETAILNGDYSSVSAGELAKYIKDYGIEFEIPVEKEAGQDVSILTRRGQIESFWNTQPFYYDKSKIFYLWNKELFKWEISDEVDFCNSIYSILGMDTINRTNKGEIVESFKQVGRMHKPKDMKKSWVQFKDKIYDVKTNEDFEASPKYFVTNPIPYKVGETEETPIIDGYFNDWMKGQDKSWKNTLYEIMAYNISRDKFMQRIIALCGGGANGKGTYAKLNYKFLGEDNCIASEIKNLSEDKFEPAVLYQKLLCVMGEVHYDDLKNTNILKKLGGEDKISFQFKGKTPFTKDNTATCLCLTNTMPITPDKTIGFYRKWLIVDFPNQFKQIDKNLIDVIPEKEFENLAKKMLRIIKELYTKPHFTNEGDFDERAKRYEERSNPIMKFIEDECIEEPGEMISLRDFTNACNMYLKTRHLRILNSNQVGKVLRDEGFVVGKRNINDISAVVIVNVRIRNTETTQKPIRNTYRKSSRDLGSFNGFGSFETKNISPQEMKAEKSGTIMYVRCFKCNNSPVEGCQYEIDGQMICDDCAKKES